jgi:hypothetical protein
MRAAARALTARRAAVQARCNSGPIEHFCTGLPSDALFRLLWQGTAVTSVTLAPGSGVVLVKP